jgi:uncharacterized membrane protein YphA (DoxX/SURF4 family)
MRHRDRVGLNLPPLLLRVLLGLVFLQTGLAKVLTTVEVSQADATLLSNMGVSVPIPPAVQPPVSEPKPDAPPTPAEPGEQPPAAEPPAAPPPEPAPAVSPEPAPAVSPAPAQTGTVAVKRLHTIALTIYRAGNPEPLDGGAPVRPMWPRDLAAGAWPRHLAWAVAIAEILGGACILLGALTRLWSLAVFGVMLGAIWLTQIGPAIQKGQTLLGFLPDYPVLDAAAWQPFWFRFALALTALALAFLGPGRASVDGLLLGGGEGDDE